MPSDESQTIRAGRFRLHEAAVDDLEEIHQVFASNPGFLWERAVLDLERHLMVVADEVTGTTVGIVDYVERSPVDELPWVGLLLIHGSHQRRGVGTTVLEAILEVLASPGHRTVRMALIEANEIGLRFARRIGFAPYGSAATALSGTAGRVVLLERPV